MRTNFQKLTVLLLTTSVLLSNCATIVSKSSYPVSIDTNPKGAQISITDKKGKEVYKGTSPSVVKLNAGAGFFAKAEYQVKLTSLGYGEKIIPVSFRLNGWYFGNIVFGGLIGMLIVDPASGAMWKIEKNADNIYETLARSAAPVAGPTLKIIDIKDVPEDMKGQLVKVK